MALYRTSQPLQPTAAACAACANKHEVLLAEAHSKGHRGCQACNSASPSRMNTDVHNAFCAQHIAQDEAQGVLCKIIGITGEPDPCFWLTQGWQRINLLLI